MQDVHDEQNEQNEHSTGPDGLVGLGGLVGALGRALDRRGGTVDAARAALAALEHDAPGLSEADAGLATVAAAFSLDPTDRALLAVALLAEVHPSAHLLCGLLSGDDHAARPSVALALELARVSVASARARERLGASGTLVRTGLLEVIGDDVLLARRLRVPDRVVAGLLGSGLPPASLLPLLARALPADGPAAGQVADALAAGADFVWVHAPIGTAGVALAVAACERLGLTCLVGDLERLGPGEASTDEGAGVAGPAGTDRPRTPDRSAVRSAIRALALEAGLDRSVLVLAGAHLAADDLRLLDTCVVPVIAVGRSPWDPRWAQDLPPSVQAGRLSIDERAAHWARALPGTGGASVDPDVLALRMTPEDIALVAERARGDATAAGRPTDVADVRTAARRLGAAGGQRVRSGTPATLDDLVLPDHTRREVTRLIGWARDRDSVLALGDLHGKGGKGSGIAALFSGSPGTGKTLAAHVVADALGMDLFQVDLSTVVDKYIGETEKNLERVFVQAESLNAVLFFDEADSLFGSRSAVTDSRDRYANQEVAYLLQRMEHAEGITVLATNLRGNLDPAFARRLHFMIHFPDPDAPTRRALWEHHLAQLPATDESDPVDVSVLADDLELAGGDIRNIVLAATYDAVAERTPVGMRHLRVSALREMSKLGRRVHGPTWSAPSGRVDGGVEHG